MVGFLPTDENWVIAGSGAALYVIGTVIIGLGNLRTSKHAKEMSIGWAGDLA